MEVGVHEAKTHLSKLLRRVAMGEVVTIRRGTTPIAQIVPFPGAGQRRFGRDRGLFEVPDDFDGPLPDELMEHFEP